MSTPRKSFVREKPEQRRTELIEATLEIIGEKGFRAATVRAIAARAKVTLGLIRHHFNSKEELICAAYEAHMTQMTNLALEPATWDDTPARERLIATLKASLTPPVLSEHNVTLWATFIAQISNEPSIKAMHERTYLEFRDRFQALISETLAEEGRAVTPEEARQLAVICNAMMDGLWVEGGVRPEGVEGDDLFALALDKLGLILGVDLC